MRDLDSTRCCESFAAVSSGMERISQKTVTGHNGREGLAEDWMSQKTCCETKDFFARGTTSAEFKDAARMVADGGRIDSAFLLNEAP